MYLVSHQRPPVLLLIHPLTLRPEARAVVAVAEAVVQVRAHEEEDKLSIF